EGAVPARWLDPLAREDELVEALRERGRDRPHRAPARPTPRANHARERRWRDVVGHPVRHAARVAARPDGWADRASRVRDPQAAKAARAVLRPAALAPAGGG